MQISGVGGVLYYPLMNALLGHILWKLLQVNDHLKHKIIALGKTNLVILGALRIDFYEYVIVATHEEVFIDETIHIAFELLVGQWDVLGVLILDYIQRQRLNEFSSSIIQLFNWWATLSFCKLQHICKELLVLI